ncbi:hypothetical protein ANCCEY_00783 [Ancylostoma ceylanicum]|uniref:RRM domain-containing protein n=1 Tax=Ancylostoma ceylanicum TaxID=53326 RepID=A0A0D6M7J4_9BILA|nr:hypothetical protein ANCCEY_00783 [Ancylostoma ceylanicum]
MSLDEIIAKNRQEKKGSGRGEAFVKVSAEMEADQEEDQVDDFLDDPSEHTSTTTLRYQSPCLKLVVSLHLKLVVRSGNPNKTVRINISNLAPSVVSSDLEELFANYRIEAATVNYNESGVSVGTGDIYLRKADADNVINDFKGVALDGQVMRMVLVDGSDSLGSRVQVTPHISSGGVQRSYRNGGKF